MRALLAALLLTPVAAHAACTNDLPGSGVLNFHPNPTSDGVIGGVSPNQCGIEVTDFCEAGRCLAFYEGLSGYIDVTGLQSGTIDPAPTAFVYDVTGADGTMTSLGQSTPFAWEPGPPIRIEPGADHVNLFLPHPFPKPIRMESTGSSGWEAVLPDWAGVPIPVVMYFDKLGAQSARLEMFTDDEIFQLDAVLFLQRVMGDTEDVIIGADGPPPCVLVNDMAQRVGAIGQEQMIDDFYTAVDRAGITDWDNMTPGMCAVLLDELNAVAMELQIEVAEDYAATDGQ
ncbi:hypothetical protein [Cognatiyoonia sp. IB215182]|uniref:hypothetical protein n=1 Tax=Cognatiyoonia sp. IB215182 TaxID=3097353 RepID=UPI002A13D827|nr:hypothetical protein [Cognatiyoonia sp. IB215182]MDX8352937.1 hypothetical protein [Cognatiyoonia sp. IB215182]